MLATVNGSAIVDGVVIWVFGLLYLALSRAPASRKLWPKAQRWASGGSGAKTVAIIAGVGGAAVIVMGILGVTW
jgi:hypothetical protein